MNAPLTLAQVGAALPELTIEGYGIAYHGSRAKANGLTYREAFDCERARLIDPSERRDFDRACAWLASRQRLARPNRRIGTSYWLKHIFEEDEVGGGCYVPNGIFIAACAAMGFVLEAPGACGLNPYVGFAKADLPRVRYA
jgi:hypothetical protein